VEPSDLAFLFVTILQMIFAREVIISAGPTSRNEWMLNRGSGVNSMTQQFIFRKLNNTRIFSEIGECNVLGLSYS
jgi:hypothetical protein